jgi:hypothetical protein
MIKFLIFIFTFIFLVHAQEFSVHFSAPMPPPPPLPPPGFVVISPDDEDMNRSDLMVISPNRVGFWVMNPYGRYVLHCRSMQYDRRSGEWFYGPWHEDRNMTYDRYRHSSFYNKPFNNYMQERYPKYYDKRFNHREKQEWKEEKRRDDRQDNWKEEKRKDDRRDDKQDWDNKKKHDKDDRDREHR